MNSFVDVFAAILAPGFAKVPKYVPEAHNNPQYLFKKKHYSRRKRKQLLAKHRHDIWKGKYGMRPIELLENLEFPSVKLTFKTRLTAGENK